jgi:hypothetical protein
VFENARLSALRCGVPGWRPTRINPIRLFHPNLLNSMHNLFDSGFGGSGEHEFQEMCGG